MNEDYLNFYKAKLQEPLTELDELRKKIIKNRIALTVISAICILIHSLLIVFEIIAYPLTIFITLFGLPLLSMLVYKKFFDKIDFIEDALKELLTKEILTKHINPSMSKEDMFIPYIDFLDSQLYSLQPEHYAGNYYMKGGKLMTMASCIDAGFENAEGGWETIFNGYFIICEEKFTIPSTTIIIADDIQQNLGLLGRKLKETSFNKYEFVNIPHKEFAKNFAVYTTNVAETYKLVDDIFINKLLMAQEEYGATIGITVSPKRIYASISFPDGQFEFNHWKTLLNPSMYTPLYMVTQLIVDLVRDTGMSFIKKEPRAIT